MKKTLKHLFIILTLVLSFSLLNSSVDTYAAKKKVEYKTSVVTDNKTKKKAKQIVKKLIKKNMSEFEKAKVLHDWLVLNNYYDDKARDQIFNGTWKSSNPSYDAKGALIKGKAVCGGLTEAYKLLCEYAGLKCEYVRSSKLNHAWNEVKIDGKWYIVDITFDVGTASSKADVTKRKRQGLTPANYTNF